MTESKVALKRVMVQFATSKAYQQIESAWEGGLTHYQNNAFYSTQPLDIPCKIDYTKSNEDDVLVKVYALDAAKHAFDEWSAYVFVDYIHSEAKPGSVAIEFRGSYFLGIVLHKELFKDEAWKLRTKELERKLGRLGGWQSRLEHQAKTQARDADFLLSRATANKDHDDKLLEYLIGNPVRGPHGEKPITFCTDRSLGLGQHFETLHDAKLYLGKHRFGEPVDINAWFEPFLRAAGQTRHGMLVVNPSPQYFQSDACKKEVGRVPVARMFIYDQKQNRIVPRNEFPEHWADEIRPFVEAVQNGNISQVREFIQADGNLVHSVSTWNSNPLHVAAGSGQVQIAQLMIEGHASVCQDQDWYSPLHAAAKAGHRDVASLLHTCGAVINCRVAGTGWFPLHYAARWGHQSVTEFLLERSANPDCRANPLEMGEPGSGATPLYLAVLTHDMKKSHSNEAVIKVLIEFRADVHALCSTKVHDTRNVPGTRKTALDVAKEKKTRDATCRRIYGLLCKVARSSDS